MGCVSSKALKKDLALTNNGAISSPHHVVSLTSTTYGLLNIENHDHVSVAETPKQRKSPPHLEVINAWELMEDLQDEMPIEKTPKSGIYVRRSPMTLINRVASPKKLKSAGGKENSIISGDFSPKCRRKRSLSPLFSRNKMVSASPSKRRSAETILKCLTEKCPPGGENAVVIYTTTLRAVRKTFEECSKVRWVVESHDILVRERDISMDSGLKEELRELTGEVRVPMVFVRGRVVGGVEEVLKMEEEGQLGVLLEGMPRAAAACGGCGGFRFVMCGECNGSCKILDSKRQKTVRCGRCNQNGLVHCPICPS